jgi:hypothetical protein
MRLFQRLADLHGNGGHGQGRRQRARRRARLGGNRSPVRQRRLQLEPLESRWLLSTIYLVDSLEDVVAADGVLTLREAILAANTNQAVNEAPAGSPDAPDVIQFHPDLAGGTIVLSGQPLVITEDLQIVGPGADQLTIDGGGRAGC